MGNYRLLIVEPDRHDCRITCSLLAEDGPDQFVVSWADSLSEALTRLRNDGANIILLELDLKETQGLNTLRAIYNEDRNIPVVVLTGLVNEHLAVEAIGAGAQEFLLKGDIDGKALRRYLNCALRRAEADRASREKLSLLENIFDNLNEAVVASDLQGRILLWNKQAERLVGKRIEQTQQNEWVETYGIYLPDGLTPYPLDKLPMSRAMRGETVHGAELVLREKVSGKARRFIDNANPIRDSAGNVIGGVVSMRQVGEAEPQRIGASVN